MTIAQARVVLVPGSTYDAHLIGVLIVDPPATQRDPRERVMVITALEDTIRAPGVSLEDRGLFAINGLSWPQTERLNTQPPATACGGA